MKRKINKNVGTVAHTQGVLNNKKAITLVALVITIVVLIILAAVAINLSLGNNGIFNKAKYAKQEYLNAKGDEETQLAKTTNDIENYINNPRENDYVSREEFIKLEEKLNKLIPVELYSGNTAGNFTLKQSIDDFSEIEIIYTEAASLNGTAYSYIRATPSKLKSGIALNTFAYTGDASKKYLQLFSCNLIINGTTATRSTTSYAINLGHSTALDTISGTGNINITKVSGYY